MIRLQNHIKRGTTIVEMIVYTVLLGVVLTCIYWVLVASMRYYRIADSSVELQQNAMNTMVALTNDLSESMAATIYDCDGSTPKGIIFASPRNRLTSGDTSGSYVYDSSRNLLWSKWVCYYVDSGNCLVRREYYKSAAGGGEIEPAVPSDHSTTLLFQNDTTLTSRVVGRYISDISFTLSGTQLSIVVSFEKSPSSDRRNTMQIRSEVQFRNK